MFQAAANQQSMLCNDGLAVGLGLPDVFPQDAGNAQPGWGFVSGFKVQHSISDGLKQSPLQTPPND